MSKKMAGILIAYGVVLAGLGLVLQKIAPTTGRVAFFAGVAGGGLSLVWGVTALAGLKGRVWATLSTIATIVVLLSQAVSVWTTSATGGTIRLVVTVMFLMTMGMVMYLFHGERPPVFYEKGTGRRDNQVSSGKESPSRDTRSKR
jgi:hypothetical protein